MKEFSTEVIEIGDKEYKLFLNRKGLVAFEKIGNIANLAQKLLSKYDNKNDFDFDGSVNPLETYGNEDEDSDLKEMRKAYIKFYWIVLYENHKLTYDEVVPLFDQAEKEYGLQALMELSNQMIEDINDQPKTSELKKLKALRPKTK